MVKNTKRLGRGLSALVTQHPVDAGDVVPAAPVGPTDALAQPAQSLPIDRIVANPRQPRSTFDETSLAELAESIRTKGLLQPIVVRAVGDGAFELVAGERRWRAAKLAGLDTIPAVVRDLSDSESLEIALIENIQREDLAPLERAAAYRLYLDRFGGSVEELAKKLCESRANVSNYLRLRALQPEVCFMLGNGQLSMGHARAIAGVANVKQQLAIARLAARRNLSVRQVEELARKAGEAAVSEPGLVSGPEESASQAHIHDLEKALSKSLGLRVRLHPGRRKNSGRLVISYGSLEEFEVITRRLSIDVDVE